MTSTRAPLPASISAAPRPGVSRPLMLIGRMSLAEPFNEHPPRADPRMVAERHHIGTRCEDFITIASVMPKPPAAFSPLMTTQSSFQRARRAGSCSVTA